LNLKASRLSRFFSPFAGEGNGRVTAQGRPAAGDVPGRTCSSISEDTRRIADELFASSTLLGWGEGYTPSSVRLGTEMLERSNKPSRRVGSSSPGTEGSNLLPSSGESRANLTFGAFSANSASIARATCTPPALAKVSSGPVTLKLPSTFNTVVSVPLASTAPDALAREAPRANAGPCQPGRYSALSIECCTVALFWER
jgi:hypothetical protein